MGQIDLLTKNKDSFKNMTVLNSEFGSIDYAQNSEGNFPLEFQFIVPTTIVNKVINFYNDRTVVGQIGNYEIRFD